jgi:uncharacterized protein YukE
MLARAFLLGKILQEKDAPYGNVLLKPLIGVLYMLQADPYQLRYLANRFAAVADEIRRKAIRMEEISHDTTGGSSGWKGQGATQFVNRTEFLSTELRDAVKQFDSIVSTLHTLASRVEMIQGKEQRLHHLQQERSQLHWGLDVSKDAEIAALNTQIYMLEAEITADRLFADTAASAAFQIIQFREAFQEVWQQVQQAATATVAKMEEVPHELLDAAEKTWEATPEPIKEAVKGIGDFAEGYTATYLQNEAMGLVDPLHEEFPEDRSSSYKVGRLVGDLAATVQGAGEMLLGGGLDVVGGTEAVVTSETVVLPAIGVAALAAGTAVAGHGWSSFNRATKGLGEDWSLFKNDGSAGGGEGGATTEAQNKVKPFDIVEYGNKNKGMENHHGVMDAWAKNNIDGYKSRAKDSTAMELTKEQHAATKRVFGSGSTKNLDLRGKWIGVK